MSVVMCEQCDRHVDSDEGTIEVWEPRIVCEDCFQKMDPVEAWNLATEAAAKIAEQSAIPGHNVQGPSCVYIAKKIREGAK